MQQDSDSSWRLRRCSSSETEVELSSQGQNIGNREEQPFTNIFCLKLPCLKTKLPQKTERENM